MLNKKRVLSLAVTATIFTTILSGCSALNGAALIKINGSQDKITYGYANFTAKLTQAMYDVAYSSYAGIDLWSSDFDNNGKTLEDDVKDNIIDTLEEQYVLAKHADEFGIKVSDDKKKNIEKTAKKFMEDNKEEALVQLGATQEYVEKYLTDRYVTDKMRAAIEAKADKTVTDEEANQKTISYVFFNTLTKTDADGNTQAVSDEEKKTMKANAESLVTAEDFEKRTTDMEMTSTQLSFGKAELKDAKEAKSYTDTNGSTVPYSLLEAADKLKDGETSAVIEEDGALYVAHMNTTKDEAATEIEIKKLEEEKISEYYESELKKYKAEYAWKVDKKIWKNVRFIDRFSGSLVDTEDAEK